VNRRQFLTTFAGAAGAAAIAPKFILDDGSESDGLVHHATWIMGQIANIWIDTDRQDEAGEAVSATFEAMRNLESALSLFDPSSELRTFLDGPVDVPFRASPRLGDALELALQEWRRTGGAFDPCVTVGRGSKGPQAFQPREGRITLPSREAGLDFGGIGCGIALDLAGRELRRRGMCRSLIELSGDFLALDAPRGWKGWPLAAADPWTGMPSDARFDLVGSALATSATVERQSILDPRDGSYANRLAQVTVVASTATHADAWSTALVVKSVERLCDWKAEFDFHGRLAVT
jgi:thiamine biosynthesis lipoprotein ApbE